VTIALTLTPASLEAADGMIEVSVVIATQRRPDPLRRAVASVLAQAGVDFARLELLVVDNDERPSALATLSALAAGAPLPIRFVHEPDPGVANARNAGVEVTAGRSIAFLDDDEEAPPTWLAALVDAQRRFRADAVFAPVRARMSESVGLHRPYFLHFFSRLGPEAAGVIDDYYGCGNSLVRRAALPDPHRPFSPGSNRTGGEDDMLFRTMMHAGARFAWAPEAWVWEDPPPERLSLAYCVRRAFAFGQGVTYYCARGEPADPVGAIGWMAKGVVQAGLFGAAAAVQWLTRSPRLAFTLDRAAKGLGKVLWGGPFAIHFYGHRVAKPAPTEVPAGAGD
jgi:succinoglycan biosynthesis protein ExoM